MKMERMIEMIIAMTMVMLLATLMLLNKQMKKHNNNNMAQKEAVMRGRGRRCFYVPRPFHAP